MIFRRLERAQLRFYPASAGKIIIWRAACNVSLCNASRVNVSTHTRYIPIRSFHYYSRIHLFLSLSLSYSARNIISIKREEKLIVWQIYT